MSPASCFEIHHAGGILLPIVITARMMRSDEVRVMLNPLPKEIVRQHTLNAMPPSIETSHTLQIDTLGSIENHTQSIEILEPRRSARNRKPKVIFDI